MDVVELSRRSEEYLDEQIEREGVDPTPWLNGRAAGLGDRLAELPDHIAVPFMSGFAMGITLERHDRRSVYLDSDRRALVNRALTDYLDRLGPSDSTEYERAYKVRDELEEIENG